MSDSPDSAAGTSWDLVKQLHAAGTSREDILARLKERGHDDEEGRVLVNSVMGALPPELPEARLASATNALAPQVFSLTELGLEGHPTVVGQYWMGLGAAILIALAVGGMLTLAGLAELPDQVGFYAVRLGGVASMTCIAWGAFRYLQGIRIRRR